MSLGSPSEADQYWESASEPRLTLLCNDSSRGVLQPSQLAARREALEAERRALKRVQCRLDASLNDLQPVNSLPSDVLTHIFLIVMHSCWDPNERPSSVFHPRPFSPKWLSLVRVCRRWRAEALACPSLWTRLATSMRPKMLTDFIQRSQDASLSLTTDRNRYRATADLLNAVFVPAILERIKDANLVYGGLGSQPHIYLSKLAHPMPRLETFTYRHEPSVSSFPVSNTAPLPSSLFNGFAPRLGKLVLGMLPEIPQLYPFYENLRVFCLYTSNDSNFAHPPSARLFELLEAMPRLEHLELKHTLPTDPFTPYGSAPLPRAHLKFLTLYGPILACTCVLRGIRLSSNCSVDIDCDASDAPTDAFADLVDALASAGIKNVTPRSLSVISDFTRTLRVAAYTEKLYHEDLREAGHRALVRIDASGLSDVDNSVMPPHIATLSKRVLSLQQLETLSFHIDMGELEITGGPTASSELRELWRTVLGPCPLLHEVHCMGAPAFVLLDELATQDPFHFLPGLKTFVFGEHRVSRHLLYEGVSLYDLLLHALQRRQGPWIQIHQQQPFLNAEDVAVLEQFPMLERFYAHHGEEILTPPEHFFGFGPDWGTFVMGVAPDAEMADIEDAPEEDFFDVV